MSGTGFQASDGARLRRNTSASCDEDPSPAKAPNFDRIAAAYRWMEWITFGPWLWRCRCTFLPVLGLRRSALILGDGDGRFTARLLAENKTVLIDAVDGSSAMLEAQVRRAGPYAGRISAHLVDVRTWEPGGANYDLIVTHFLLDCLTTEEVACLAMRLRACVRPDVVWVVSEFAVPSGYFGLLVARPLISFLYRVFGWLTGLKVRHLPDYREALSRSGFILARQQTWLGGLLVSEIWETSSGY